MRVNYLSALFFLCLVLAPAAQAGTPGKGASAIGASHTGTYVVDGLNDQGFFLTVDENESGPFLFFSWFTFSNGQPFWLVGVEFFESGDSTVNVPVGTRRGPGFLDFSGAEVSAETLGTMRFTAENCTRFSVDYDLGSAGSGTLLLDRLTGIKDLGCEAAEVR